MAHPLYLLRKTLGFTQAQLAAEIGVTESRVSQIEGGEGGRLSDERLLALIEKYGVEVARLGLSLGDFLRPLEPASEPESEPESAAAGGARG